MAKCDEGYLCSVCGDEVDGILQSDLYLRFVIGEVDPERLHTSPERHIRCNPILAQFIKDEDFTEAIERDKIPDGFNNNLLWNFGHCVVTQQLLCYKLSGLEMQIETDLIEQLCKATSPKDWTTPPDIQVLRELAISLPEKLAFDYADGRFKEFKPYETSAGVTLSCVEDAIEFNNFHEGIHVGYVAIDAVIDVPWTRQAFADRPDEFFSNPADIADEVFHVAHQPKSTWSFDTTIRPYGEEW